MKAIVRKNQTAPGQGKSSFSFSFVNEDGSSLLISTRYRSKDSAYKGVRAVKKHCVNNNRYIFETSPQGKHSFRLKSANGLVVADSVSFSSEQERKEIVDLIKTRLPECEIQFQLVSIT